MVLASRRDVSPLRAQDYFDGLAAQLGLSEIPIDERVGRLAVECFERYGRGRHPAGLNFGDCLSYGLCEGSRRGVAFQRRRFRPN
jgi:ribonuclease VapC